MSKPIDIPKQSKCGFIFPRGTKRGSYCDVPVTKGEKFCKEHTYSDFSYGKSVPSVMKTFERCNKDEPTKIDVKDGKIHIKFVEFHFEPIDVKVNGKLNIYDFDIGKYKIGLLCIYEKEIDTKLDFKHYKTFKKVDDCEVYASSDDEDPVKGVIFNDENAHIFTTSTGTAIFVASDDLIQDLCF